jgi:hypothetical protein
MQFIMLLKAVCSRKVGFIQQKCVLDIAERIRLEKEF